MTTIVVTQYGHTIISGKAGDLLLDRTEGADYNVGIMEAMERSLDSTRKTVAIIFQRLVESGALGPEDIRAVLDFPESYSVSVHQMED